MRQAAGNEEGWQKEGRQKEKARVPLLLSSLRWVGPISHPSQRMIRLQRVPLTDSTSLSHPSSGFMGFMPPPIRYRALEGKEVWFLCRKVRRCR